MKTVPLRRLATMTYGDALASDQRIDGAVPVMSSGGVTGRHDVANTLSPVIVVGRKGSHGSVWWSDVAAFVIDTAYSIDSSNTDCDLRWLYYTLSTMRLSELSNDVGVPGLSRDATYAASVPLMGSEQQRRIADFLDSRVARIDQIIAARREQKVLTAAEVASELQRLIDDRPYTVCPLQALTDPWRPIQYGIVLPGPNFEGGVPIIKGGDIGSGRLSRLDLNRTDPDIEAAYRRSRVRPGDLVVAIRGSVGEVARVPGELQLANLTQDSARIASAGCDEDWLIAVLRAPSVQSAIAERMTGSTVKGINIADLRRLPIPVPDSASQASIGRAATAVIEDLGRRTAALQRSIELLIEYKQSLITAAVTGLLDVTTAGGGMPA